MPRWIRPAAAVAALAVMASVGVPLLGPVAADAATVVRITGPDVSSHQHDGGNTVNWPSVKAAGNSFAFVKATEGSSYTNPYYASDTASARAAGLVVGAYHFARPRLPLSTATTDAKKFIAVTGKLRTTKTLPPILDIESADSLSVANRLKWTYSFLGTVRSLTGRTPMIYSYGPYITSRLGNSSGLAKYPLWYANYPRTYSSTTPTPTALPGAWNALTFWQYTSSARVPGFTDATIDMNRFNGTLTSLLRLADGTKAAPSAPSAPTSLVATLTWPDVKVTWSPPTSTGGSVITNYVVRVDGGPAVSTPTTSFVAGPLDVGSHTISVRAVTISGTGPAATITVTFPPPGDGTSVAPPAATTLTLSTPTTVSRSVAAPISVTLRRADTKQVLPGQLVSFTAKPKAGATQRIRLFTDSGGVVTTTMAHRTTTLLTAQFVGTDRLTTTAATATLRVRPRPLVKLSSSRVRHGATTYLKGNMSKLYVGETVRRQLYFRGAWVDWATTKVRADGTYVFKIRTTKKASYRYRVRVAATTLHLAGKSRSVRLTIT